jgi:sulfate adenylyltransferase subunit 2
VRFVEEANKTFQDYREFLVAYSGGKDSLSIMDLVMQSKPHKVEAFFMYFVPGLACVEERLEWARKRWGIVIHQYPHWAFSKAVAYDVFRLPSPISKTFGEWGLLDVYAWARKGSGIQTIVHGAKKSDSQWRRRSMAAGHNSDGVIYPIAEWSKFQVLAYLRGRNIPIPHSSAGNATGIDLTQPSLLWLYDNHPEDFRKVCEYFPFAEAEIWRRKFYGKETH